MHQMYKYYVIYQEMRNCDIFEIPGRIENMHITVAWRQQGLTEEWAKSGTTKFGETVVHV